MSHGRPYTCRLCQIRAPARQVNELAGWPLLSKLPERLNESSSRRFDGKGQLDKRFRTTLVHKLNQRSSWGRFSHEADMLAYLQLWQRLRIMDSQCSYTDDFFEA